MKKYSFKERFQYWFDNLMAKGTSSMVKMLMIASAIVVLLATGIITIAGLQEEPDVFVAFWDSLATVINAWMPYSDDGGTGYIILTAIVAVVGLFFTSVLIGIVSTAIEEKITDLRKGSSRILEEKHVVVLGFEEGEYELIRQLVIAAGEEKRCIVVAGAGEKDEMEAAISDNVDIPKNVKIICRHADIFDPVSLECCSIPDSRAVVISPSDDAATIKVLLAVQSVLKDQEGSPVQIISAVSDDNYLLPESILERRHIIMLQTYDVIAKLIARSCTQPGLSEAFTEVLNFEGSEFYIMDPKDAKGVSFGEFLCSSRTTVPIGILKNGLAMLNPSPDIIIEEDDKVIVFSESRNVGRMMSKEEKESASLPSSKDLLPEPKHIKSLVIIGFNEAFDTIIRELPDDQIEILLAGVTEHEAGEALAYATERENISLKIYEGDIADIEELEALVLTADHLVLLNDHETDAEESDVKTMLLLLKIRDIKLRHDLDITITAEMHRESNRRLIAGDNPIDFIVASNMSSMVLAQMTENPKLYQVYRELISNHGNDLCLKRAERFVPSASCLTIAELRRETLACGYILIGYLSAGEKKYEITLNPPMESQVTISEEDYLVVIGLD